MYRKDKEEIFVAFIHLMPFCGEHFLTENDFLIIVMNDDVMDQTKC